MQFLKLRANKTSITAKASLISKISISFGFKSFFFYFLFKEAIAPLGLNIGSTPQSQEFMILAMGFK